jgi:SAM-dependent MidA family methyltransferase
MAAHIHQVIDAALGWIGFDRFMELALYTPGLGYYARDSRKFGHMPESGSDFVTAPEMTPLFGHAVAVQVKQALQATKTDEVWEFGAGSGALAQQLLETLGDSVQRYTIVELSATLRERQQSALGQCSARRHAGRGAGQRVARRDAGQAAGAGARALV